MIGISFYRILRTAILNTLRNVWLSVATLLIMVLTLLMLSFLFFANLFGTEVLRGIEQKVDLSASFRSEVDDEFIASFADELRERSDVESVEVISKEQALEIFKRNNADKPIIEESLQELDENPLPASVNVTAVDPEHYQAIAAHLESEAFASEIEQVNYEDSRLVIDKLIRIIDATQNVALIATAIFGVLAILIMFNTVRLAIYSFREEIDIMRLVGASRWFIQGPFVIEAVLVAVVAAVISSVALYPALGWVAPQLSQFFLNPLGSDFNVHTYAIEHWPRVIGLQLGASIALAVVSSYVAVRRYLHG